MPSPYHSELYSLTNVVSVSTKHLHTYGVGLVPAPNNGGIFHFPLVRTQNLFR